jgi:hypothetical protein
MLVGFVQLVEMETNIQLPLLLLDLLLASNVTIYRALPFLVVGVRRGLSLPCPRT